MSEIKPREFWIKQVGHWAGQDEVHDSNPQQGGFVHVIEYSAYEQLKQEIGEAKMALEEFKGLYETYKEERGKRRELQRERDELHKNYHDAGLVILHERKERDQLRAQAEALATVLEDIKEIEEAIGGKSVLLDDVTAALAAYRKGVKG